jgi:FixJ family two-component response regulator
MMTDHQFVPSVDDDGRIRKAVSYAAIARNRQTRSERGKLGAVRQRCFPLVPREEEMLPLVVGGSAKPGNKLNRRNVMQEMTALEMSITHSRQARGSRA